MSGLHLRQAGAYAGMAVLMLAANILALLLIQPMKNAGFLAFENPDSLANIVVFVFLMLVFTAILLILIKKKVRGIISIIIALCIASVIFYVAAALSAPVMPALWTYVLSAVLAAASILLLWKFPEWYVIDIIGLVVSAGCAAIFGLSLSPLPVVVLLAVLIVYDYLAVNRTKHMLTLADGVLHQKMPIMFLVPKTKGYSYRADGLSIQDRKEERSAYMIGMGDMIMPAILVVSAQVYAGGAGVLSVSGVALPALGALIGSLAGLVLLFIPLKSGKPQPGLPLINGCAIAGFLICCAAAGSWGWITGGFW